MTLDELDVGIHFVKEGLVLSRDSRSSEEFMDGIKVLMAKNYTDNLSEEARKGMQKKAEQGIWPTVAPLGYRNVTCPDGKKMTKQKYVYDRLQNRVHAAYVDKLDGRIDVAFFDRVSDEWRREQEQCLRDIEQHQGADQSYLDEGVQLLELARNAQRLFAKQEAKEKRRLLGFLVSNRSWKGGELTTELRQPFDLLQQTVAAVKTKKATEPSFDSFSEIWLPGQDSNLRQGG